MKKPPEGGPESGVAWLSATDRIDEQVADIESSGVVTGGVLRGRPSAARRCPGSRSWRPCRAATTCACLLGLNIGLHRLLGGSLAHEASTAATMAAMSFGENERSSVSTGSAISAGVACGGSKPRRRACDRRRGYRGRTSRPARRPCCRRHRGGGAGALGDRRPGAGDERVHRPRRPKQTVQRPRIRVVAIGGAGILVADRAVVQDASRLRRRRRSA